MARKIQKAGAVQLSRKSSERITGYARFLWDVKDRICRARVKAALSVNRELIELYWGIGKGIVERQRAEGWGRSIVTRLAADIERAFPGISGFSTQNIWKMRAFYLAWTEGIRNLSQPVRELARIRLQQPVGGPDERHLPQAVKEIPWGHNMELLFKLKDPIERLWYAHMIVEHGWSRPVLVHQIESGLYHRQGKAVTNFDRTLLPPQSDLAKQALKDPYVFDFLALSGAVVERDLEMGLLEHLRKFLIELGVGFAFVGSQYHLEVDGEDFYIDLIFYHLRLRCFVVIELKMEAFKPEFAGKMNFYLSAVDDLLRHSDDRPSIGIILCKAKKKLVVEYALRRTMAPIGVSEYRLTSVLPKDLKTSLPTVREFEAELRNLRRQKRRHKAE